MYLELVYKDKCMAVRTWSVGTTENNWCISEVSLLKLKLSLKKDCVSNVFFASNLNTDFFFFTNFQILFIGAVWGQLSERTLHYQPSWEYTFRNLIFVSLPSICTTQFMVSQDLQVWQSQGNTCCAGKTEKSMMAKYEKQRHLKAESSLWSM